MTPATRPTLEQALTDAERLETYYDFQCPGGSLKNCVEWIRLRQFLTALASAEPEPQGDEDDEPECQIGEGHACSSACGYCGRCCSCPIPSSAHQETP